MKGMEEVEAVAGKIRAALHESFGDRSEELFAMGSAVHADTSCIVEASAYRKPYVRTAVSCGDGVVLYCYHIVLCYTVPCRVLPYGPTGRDPSTRTT